MAVTATTVQIVDPKNPNRIAAVDPGGRLSTVGATSTISASGLIYGYQGTDNFITSPTTATLAITKISFSETVSNAGVTGNSFRIYVYKVGTDAEGNCTNNNYYQLAIYQFSAGDEVLDQFAQPLIVKPTGGAKYCIDFFSTQIGAAGTLTYFPAYHLTAYVAGGTYAGSGAATAPGPAPAKVDPRGDAK